MSLVSPLQYYEMSYGLNIEMHKQVSSQSLPKAVSHEHKPHLNPLALMYWTAALLLHAPPLTTNKHKSLETYLFGTFYFMCGCCCYILFF